MADSSVRVPENVPGKWYVDENCIACDSCVSIAPDFFAMAEDGKYACVIKQPATAEDETICQDAKAACPTDSIGDDGE